MGLATHAIALALGYALGNPEGRARLVALRGRAQEAAKRPEVKQARERAWDIAGEAGAAAKNRLTARARRRAADSAPSPSGDGSADTTPPAATPPATGTAPTATSAPASAGSGAAGGTGAPAAQDRLAGTTVAEDSRAAVLGVPAPDTDRPEPPAQR